LFTDRETIAAIDEGRHGDPFSVLGMHATPDGPVVRAFLPAARSVAVVDAASGRRAGVLTRRSDAGFFDGRVGARRRKPFAYRLRVESGGGTPEFMAGFEDIYRFPPVLGDIDTYLLAEGSHLRSWEKLGANAIVHDGVPGIAFAVWAPNARRVSVVCDANDWDGRRWPMRRRPECGVWELFVPNLAGAHLYKYEILASDGTLLLKADPYATAAEPPPGTASLAVPKRAVAWHDADWLAEREQRNHRFAPISVYEVHLGSWRRNLASGGGYLSWRELADQLIPYAGEMGFTHIEVMPITEYPFDGSWGYQPTGLFAPTARFGPPEECRAFIERCHAAGLGVWLDWVPGHFPNDPHGLARFDGTALYEHADPRQGLHRDWNTYIYNYGRREVVNFLLSNALYWLEEFHIDGLRVDAVASMLYLDYSRAAGDWIPNPQGGRENLDAVAFLRRLNELAFSRVKGATTIAEESTAWPQVSRPTSSGGLGFGFKWNMGWMHDTLRYMSKDPIHRRHHHDDLTFGLLYAFTENFVLPLSHDEVVHGKGSLLAKMPGDRWQRFANLRAYFGFMWGHPGKKLLFMGGEFAQEREWNHDIGLDWQHLDDPMHRGVQRLVRDLNRLYRTVPALHERDSEAEGFAWVDDGNAADSILSFLRLGGAEGDVALVVCNFTPMVRRDYRVGVPFAERWLERLNSDALEYGGSGVGNGGEAHAEPLPMHGRPRSLRLVLPPLATVILTPAGSSA
jgi:1,4-alpha-glucan branching enzyme